MAYLKKRMRLQSTKSKAVRGVDAYFSPYEAIWPLPDLEPNMPRNIWEPSAGDGVIVRALRQNGFRVVASDLCDYHSRGLGIQTGINYLEAVCPDHVRGIITNPPFMLAMDFINKAMREVPYHAWLLRTNFLESTGRFKFFEKNPPSRVWISSRRLPMMHRVGYDGPKSTSNTAFAWFVWDESTPKNERGQIGWFDWMKHYQDLDGEY